jgi:enediyne biosynthesis protein E4
VRELSLSRGYLSSSEPVLHFGLGEAIRIEELTVTWPSGRYQRFTDLAADRKLTITEPTTPTPRPEPKPSSPRFTELSAAAGLALRAPEDTTPEPDTQPLLPFRFDRRGPALAVADLDGDLREQIVLGGTTVTALQSNTGLQLPPSGPDDGPILLFDLDGDGDPELLRTKSGSSRLADYTPQLYRNDSGRFTPIEPPPVTVPIGAAAAADFDRDGQLDVFLGARLQPGRYPQSAPSVLLRNDGGRLVDVTDQLAPALRQAGLVTSALWTDLDQDGWVDLLVATEWGPIRYYHNDSGRGFTERRFHSPSGWWTSLASGDFNSDGRPDYVAGNAGLNTPYGDSALAFLGEFRGGVPLLIEAHEENGKLYPWRARHELGAHLPQLLRQFPRNDAFARATLPEILGERLDSAQRFEAKELRSGVFLSQPDGSHRFTPLPRIAQIAPFQGVIVADFDADGFADICAVQNSFAPIPSTGRFDGGLGQLLLGDGRGGFRPVPPDESGLVVPGDAKALVLLDLNTDGWPDLLASRNQDTTQAFRTEPVSGRRSFRVVLRGPRGNPKAIGAQVVLELADGTRQFAELHAGSGYWSQSAPGCFFGYPEHNPPRWLMVRWPDGRTSPHAVTTRPGAVVELSAP